MYLVDAGSRIAMGGVRLCGKAGVPELPRPSGEVAIDHGRLIGEPRLGLAKLRREHLEIPDGEVGGPVARPDQEPHVAGLNCVEEIVL